MSKCSMNKIWNELSVMAWDTRNKARILNKIKVGCAVYTNSGEIFVGCNVEHKWHISIHAEICALSNMVANSNDIAKYILIVAECTNFTPCGSCMDWIFELGDKNCIIGFQNRLGGNIKQYHIKELMPEYPKI